MGFFHTDRHPGNIRVLADVLCFLDYGMIGTLSARHQEDLGNSVNNLHFDIYLRHLFHRFTQTVQPWLLTF